jgi:hypothetical protein
VVGEGVADVVEIERAELGGIAVLDVRSSVTNARRSGRAALRSS